MVKVTNLIIGLDDIASIRATCTKPECRGAAVFPIDSVYSLPEACPCCGARWRDLTNRSDVSPHSFISLLKYIVQEPDTRVAIQFEVEQDA